MAEGLEGDAVGALVFFLGTSLGGGVSSLASCMSTTFSAGAGSEVTLLGVFSDGATWGKPSADFEMTAIIVPGSTVSPSLATN